MRRARSAAVIAAVAAGAVAALVTLSPASSTGGDIGRARAAGRHSVTLDHPARAGAQPGELVNVAAAIGAHELWASGLDGRGVGVALVDSGVSEAVGLDRGAIVTGPDFTADAGTPAAHVDATGHGTHLAGIIAGRPVEGVGALGDFTGIAPAAHVVSLKVVASDGTTQTADVIEAIDWAIDHRHALDLRIINLAYATTEFAAQAADPLEEAVARAAQAGIVVVVAAGNHGSEGPLASPASSPFALVVGATEADGAVADFSATGDDSRRPDVLAPGRSIVSAVALGSAPMAEHPESVVDGRLIKGTGTSQAAAVVSGAAALVLQGAPELSPAGVRAVLASSLAPGADRLSSPMTEIVTGIETEWLGSQWLGSQWLGSQWLGSQWLGSQWLGSQWLGSQWLGSQWLGSQWLGSQWLGSQWLGSQWLGSQWLGSQWLGSQWLGSQWLGSQWLGSQWLGSQWLGSQWLGSQWLGSQWLGSQWLGSQWLGSQWLGSQWLGSQWL